MPTQPVDHADVFGQQIFAVVDQEPDLTVRAVEHRNGKIRLAECDADDVAAF